jgi:hypothetical protein
MKRIYVGIIVGMIATQCTSLQANESKHHTIGVNLGFGEITNGFDKNEDGFEFTDGVFYEYQFNNVWAVYTAYLSGSDIGCFICGTGNDDLFTRPKLNYDSYLSGIKGSLQLSQRWALFGKLGVNYYKTEFADNKQSNDSQTGIGVFAATGFDFRAYNGFGLGFESKWLDMGELKSVNYTLNFSYRF